MTAATLTLTGFLLARIAEDEADVRATTLPDSQYGTPWHWRSRARVLAECEAKQRIVMRHIAIDGRCLGCGIETVTPFLDGLLVTTCPELRYLAAVYGEHPAYRDEWKP